MIATIAVTFKNVHCEKGLYPCFKYQSSYDLILWSGFECTIVPACSNSTFYLVTVFSFYQVIKMFFF